jgi:hypothetical protein
MPPLDVENASALVPGGGVSPKENDMKAQQPGTQPATLRVEVLRSFYFGGKPIQVKAEVDLPRIFALEMVAAKKAKVIEEVPVPTQTTNEDKSLFGAKKGR